MRWLATIFREVLGLFVDDGSFALAVLVWMGVIWLMTSLPRFIVGFLGMPRRYQTYPSGFELDFLWRHPLAGGLVLFAGLAVILAESVLRFSRKARRKSVPV